VHESLELLFNNSLDIKTLHAMEEKSMSKRRRILHPGNNEKALQRNGFANKTGVTKRGTKKQRKKRRRI